MKKDNPEFFEDSGAVVCDDCPFSDENGYTGSSPLCRNNDCPTRETYQMACDLADGEPHH